MQKPRTSYFEEFNEELKSRQFSYKHVNFDADLRKVFLKQSRDLSEAFSFFILALNKLYGDFSSEIRPKKGKAIKKLFDHPKFLTFQIGITSFCKKFKEKAMLHLQEVAECFDETISTTFQDDEENTARNSKKDELPLLSKVVQARRFKTSLEEHLATLFKLQNSMMQIARELKPFAKIKNNYQYEKILAESSSDLIKDLNKKDKNAEEQKESEQQEIEEDEVSPREYKNKRSDMTRDTNKKKKRRRSVEPIYQSNTIEEDQRLEEVEVNGTIEESEQEDQINSPTTIEKKVKNGKKGKKKKIKFKLPKIMVRKSVKQKIRSKTQIHSSSEVLLLKKSSSKKGMMTTRTKKSRGFTTIQSNEEGPVDLKEMMGPKASLLTLPSKKMVEISCQNSEIEKEIIKCKDFIYNLAISEDSKWIYVSGKDIPLIQYNNETYEKLAETSIRNL